ncbi:MAG: PatB family C-S lyase [Oscillospiraceae bacterium]|jgi:cystathionine beta-lyase|nr:PatB family C-S lyase [Oscillospiraceae bacterium]
MEQFTYDAAFFDAGIDRTGTDCEKWDEMQARHGSDVLPMWVADMDFRSPLEVQRALADRAAHGTYGYPTRVPQDAGAVVDYWARRHGLAFAAQDVLMLPCVVAGLNVAVRALTTPRQSVIIQPPVYGPFFHAAEPNGRALLKNPLREDDDHRWHMDLEGLEDCLRLGGKLLLLCSPHNPVSRAWTRQELSDTLALCARYDACIVTDEIHADFVYPDRVHVPLLSLPGAADRVVMLCAASKTFNIAGLRQASCITLNPDLGRRMAETTAASGAVCGNAFALVGTRAAYAYGDAWLDALRAYLLESRRIAMDFFARRLPHIPVSPLEATYLMWLDCRALGLDDAELTRRTVQMARVALSGGGSFGQEGQGFLRLNIGCPHSQLQEALDRLAIALSL